MGSAAEGVVIGQFSHGGSTGIDQLLITVAQGGTPKARHAFQVLVALVIEDIHAVAVIDLQLFYGLEISDWVNKGGHDLVTLCGAIQGILLPGYGCGF